MLTLDRVSLAQPDGAPLFSDLTLSLPDAPVGLFGRNGAGKTTLLRAIAGEIAPVCGTIQAQGRIGFLRQHAAPADASIANALGIAEPLARLDRIENGRAVGSDMDRADWSLPARIAQVLARLGLPSFDLTRTIGTLSGGERTRIAIAALLLDEPDILLLDEPTNNLDDAGRAAVHRLVAEWNGPMLIASHDRELLREVSAIVELSRVGTQLVGGNWDDFVAERDARRHRAQADLDRARNALAHVRSQAQAKRESQQRSDKRGRQEAAKGSQPKMFLHKQAQRAQKTSGRGEAEAADMQQQAGDAVRAAERKVERLTPIDIAVPPCGLASNHVLVEARSISRVIEGRSVFGPMDLIVRGPERIALTEPNGSGKTGLVRVLIGQDSPQSGTICCDTDRIAVLDQHLGLLGDTGTMFDAMRRLAPSLDRRQVHAALAAYGFRAQWAEREIGSLSGGERVRLALACLFARPNVPQLLILDEPTNHLDIEAIEMLERALVRYDGAIMCIAHDAAFRSALNPTREIALRG
jgi:ATPase subunit of ABC transporter with duplicated ATPase domains